MFIYFQFIFLCIFLYREFSELGFNRLSNDPTKQHIETEYGLKDPRNEYYKFAIVRHPLERLASGYLDKVLGSKKGSKTRTSIKVTTEHNMW